MVTQGLEWGYNGGAQTDASLRSTANYLWWLCGKFQLEAQNIINGPGGGSVVPVNPTNKPLPLDFEVSGSSIIAAGASSATISSFIGYNVDFSRGGIEQNTTDVGGSYFTWDRQTGIFTCSPAAQSGELFRITPV